MLRFACLMLLATCCLADDLNLKSHWGSFKSSFKKQYSSKAQEALKQAHWEGKVKSILKHNLDADLGLHSYKKGINEFTDLTDEEFKNTMLGAKMPANLTFNFLPSNLVKSERALPDNFDWRTKNVVGSVKNQGSCGSCWTFSVAGTMEGAWGIKSGKLEDFSEQQMLDCATPYGTTGCSGGWPNDAFEYIKANGLGKEECYKYENKAGTCRTNNNCMITKISNHYDVPHTEDDLKQYLYNYGPVSITVYVNNNFSSYKSGIYYDNNCNGYVNHAILLVGYGVENGKDFWIVKNSWGSGWGENGYIRMARNYNNMCKIANYASIPWI